MATQIQEGALVKVTGQGFGYGRARVTTVEGITACLEFLDISDGEHEYRVMSESDVGGLLEHAGLCEPGDELKLFMAGSNAAISCRAFVVGLEDRRLVVAIADVKWIQRRASHRVSCDLEALVTFDGHRIPSRVIDISLGGIRLGLPPGAFEGQPSGLIDVDLNLDGRNLELRARVIAVERGDQRRLVLRCAFVKLHTFTEEHIATYVTRSQLEGYRQERSMHLAD